MFAHGYLGAVLAVLALISGVGRAADPKPVAFDTHDGYFVSNKFEPGAPASFVVLQDQEAFDGVFGAGFVMRDKHHRLPKDAFDTRMVVAAIKRGKAMWTFKVESVTAEAGVLTLRYTANARPDANATFACPLIVSIPRGDYSAVQFVENAGEAKKIALKAAQGAAAPAPPPAAIAKIPAFDAATTATDFRGKLKPLIPETWNAAAEKNTVTVSRQKPVEWYGAISLPPHKDKADLKAQGFVHSSTYAITIEFGPPMTPEEVAQLNEKNRRIMEAYYQQHPVDPRAKPTSPPKEVTQSLHRIPNVLTARYSALVTPFIQGSLAFYDADDEADCRRVEATINKALIAR